MKQKGQPATAAIIAATQKSPTRAPKILERIQKEVKEMGVLSTDEALALLLETGLSIRAYNTIRWGELG